MAYQPLTKEQYEKALKSGFTHQQIVVNERRRKAELDAAEAKKGDQGLKGVATGVAKGELDTVRNLTKFTSGLASIPGRLVNKVAGRELIPDVQPFLGTDFNEDTLAPEGNAEKIGFGAERIAELAAPGGAITKTGKAAQTAIKGAVGTSAAGRTAGLAGRAATEGLAGGAQAALQEGEFNKDALDAAIISAAFPAAGSVISQGKKLSRTQARELAPRVVNSLIKPLKKDLSYGKNPGRAVAEEGIIANNLDELAVKITERKNAVGDKIELALSTPAAQATRLDLSESLRPLQEAIEQARKNPRTNSALISRLENLEKDILGVVEDADGTITSMRQLDDLSPLEATQLKRDIGDLTKYTGNASDDGLINKALQRTYTNIRKQVDEAVPEVVPLNERYADLVSAKIATEYRNQIAERQNLITLDTKTFGAAGTILASIASGGVTLPAVLVGLGAAGTQKALSSPRVKTEFASWLASATQEQKKALFETAPWLRAAAIRLIVGDD